jgi:uncharacterized membrane protein
VRHVSGPILWANLHLLFWLSLVPFATGWMGENHFQALPTALYGGVLLMAGLAYYLLQKAIIANQGAQSLLKQAIGNDMKGKLSLVAYAIATPLALHFSPMISLCIYVLVALMWFIPDRRIESRLLSDDSAPH